MALARAAGRGHARGGGATCSCSSAGTSGWARGRRWCSSWRHSPSACWRSTLARWPSATSGASPRWPSSSEAGSAARRSGRWAPAGRSGTGCSSSPRRSADWRSAPSWRWLPAGPPAGRWSATTGTSSAGERRGPRPLAPGPCFAL